MRLAFGHPPQRGRRCPGFPGEEVVAADEIDAASPGEVVVARIDELLPRNTDVERNR